MQKFGSLNRRRGQSMTEYVILVGLLAILLVTAVATFKNKIEETFNKSTNSIDSNITQKITQASAT